MIAGASVAFVAVLLMWAFASIDLFLSPPPSSVNESILDAMPTWRAYMMVAGVNIIVIGSLMITLASFFNKKVEL